MSSPISGKSRSIFDRALVNLHQRASHNKRVEIVARNLSRVIEKEFNGSKALKALDIGCGDMSISIAVRNLLPEIKFSAIDIHPLPASLTGDLQWANYRQFDGENIPFSDDYFDIGILCDVLHHVPEAQQVALLRETLRTCKTVVVKDHFEYGWASRQLLRSMDFVGNYGYGISVPKRYFTKRSLEKIFDSVRGSFKVEIAAIDLYSHLPIVKLICRPELQVIGVARSTA